MEYVESVHDYEVRFLECFGTLEEKVIFSCEFNECNESNKSKMKYLEVINSNYNIGNLNFNIGSFEHDSHNKNISFNNDIFTLPKLGFINTSFFAVYYERRHKKSSPSRYRRGLRQDTLELKNISNYEVAMLTEGNNPVGSKHTLFFASIHDLFFPHYFTYEEAIESILTFQRLSAAITNTLALKYDMTLNSIQLLKNNWVIGDYSDTKKGIILRNDFFIDDILEHNIKVVK